jgi:NAD(P)-dependent dehydrogenase (short-subunit alcohol dehydrogenase family)
MEKIRSESKIAVVTGASSGIGKAIAERLAQAGYRVYGTSRRGGQAGLQPFEMLALDVTDDESVEAAVEQVMQREGRIDLLVNNAGFGIEMAGAEESSTEQAQAIFDTNFFGTLRMTRAVVPHMRHQGGRRIINIGSIVGLLPMPYMTIYAASKHAIEGYSESLDHELRTMGIRVSIVEPGITKTSFDTSSQEADSKLEEYRGIRAAVTKRMMDLYRVGDEPAVVAETVLKVAKADNPKLRYTAGSAARRLSLLRRFAPTSLVDTGVRKNLGLSNAAPI